MAGLGSSFAWILLAAICTSSSITVPATTHEQQETGFPEDQSEQAFQMRLEVAAQEVTGQHLTPGPPQFEIPPGFMHAYVSNTGASNRQVTIISNIVEESLLPPDPVILAWRNFRFNHTDYMAATIATGCYVWATTPPLTEPIDLNMATFTLVTQKDSAMTLCDLHQSQDSLLLTTMSRDSTGRMINVYNIIQGRASHLYERRLDDDNIGVTFLDYEDHSLTITVADGLYNCVFQETKNAEESVRVSFPGAVSSASFSVSGRGFLLVANSSLCLLISLGGGQCEIFDRMSQDAITSVTSFSFHSTRYVVLSSSDIQTLYQWRPDGLTLVQQLTIPSVTETHVVSHQHCREDVFLVLVGGGGELHIYTWDGARFNQSTGVMVPSVHPSPNSLSFLSRDDELLMLCVEDGRSRSFALRTALSPVQDPSVQQFLRITDDMNAAESVLRDQERRSGISWDVLNHAVLTSPGPVTFQSRQRLPHLHTEGDLRSDYLLSQIRELEWLGSPLTSDDLKWTFGELDSILRELEGRLDLLETQIGDAVLTNEPSHVTGHKTILGSVTSPSAAIAALSLVEAGGRSLDQSLQHLYRLDSNDVISGKKTFKGDLHVTGNADLKQVNGVAFSTDLLLTSVPQHVTGRWSFDHTLVVNGDLEMEGRLNDLDFSSEVVTLDSPATVQSLKTFTQTVHVKETLTTPRLDGVLMEELFLNSLTRTHSQVIHVLPPVLLETISTKISELNVNGLVNGLDISRLEGETARTDRPAEFKTHKTFVEPNFEGGIVALGSYDGVNLPFDVFEPAVPSEFRGRKHFEHAVVKNAKVHGFVDGIDLNKDVVTLTGDQEILDKVFASGLTVQGDLIFGQRIDGVTVEDMESLVTEPRSGSDINAVFLEPVVVEKNLVIESLMGVDLEALERDLVYPGDTEVVFTGRKSFGEVEVAMVTVGGTVNGYDVRKDFVTTGTDQYINGTKVFTRAVVFGHHLETGNVDGVDISSLATSYVSLTGSTGPSRTFYDRVTSTGHVTVSSDLTVTGRVNGMELTRDLVLRDVEGATALLTNKVLAGGLTINGHVDVQGDVRVGLLDGVDFEHFVRRRVTLTSDQELERSLVVGGSRAQRVTAAVVNGMDLERVALDVMTLTTPQLVTGRKTFTGPVFIPSHVESLDGINGVDITRLSTQVRRLDTPMTFVDRVTLDDDLLIEGDLRVTGRVKGVDLSDLESRALKKSSPLVLTGHNVFGAGLDVRGDVIAKDVNRRRLDSDVLLRHGDQDISGAYTLGTVRTSDVTLTGPLNNLDVVQLDSTTAKTHSSSIFLSDLNLHRAIRVLQDTVVKGTVNGLSLQALQEQAVIKESKGPQMIQGRKAFVGAVVVAGDAEVGTVNGIGFTEFLRDVVYVDSDQTIPSKKRFTNTFLTPGIMNARGRTEVSGRVDNVQLDTLVQNVVFIDQPAHIIGDVHYLDASTIHVLTPTGRVNGISLQHDVLLLNKEDAQIVRGKKTIREVTSETSLVVMGTVNGHRLPDLVHDTLFLHSDQTVIGSKTITGPVKVVRPHYGVVNKVDLTREVYVIDHDIEIHDNVIFHDDVSLRKELNLNGLVNGVDLGTLREEALMTTGYQEILSPFVVEQVVSGDVIVEGHVSGIDVDRLRQEVLDFHSGQGQVVGDLKDQVQAMAGVVNGMLHMAQVAPYSLHSLVLWQSLNTSGWIVESTPDAVHLVDPSTPHLVHTWHWQGERLAPHLTLPKDGDVHKPCCDRKGQLPVPEKYSVAELFLDHVTVTATVSPDVVHFSRSFELDGQTHDVTLNIPNAKGVRLFTSGSDIHALVSSGSPSLCRSGTVHLLRWNRDEPVPVPIQQFQGGDLDFGVFELDRMQYILIAGRDSNPELHQTIKVYHRGCSCASGLFSLHSSLPLPVSLDLFSVDDHVYLATANTTTVQLHRFQGIMGFRLHTSLPVTHALNVRAVEMQGQVFLVVGQMPGVALVFKVIWNGDRLVPRHFTRWL